MAKMCLRRVRALGQLSILLCLGYISFPISFIKSTVLSSSLCSSPFPGHPHHCPSCPSTPQLGLSTDGVSTLCSPEMCVGG